MREAKLLVVTWTAFPPTSGTGVILSNLLEHISPSRVVLAGEHTYGGHVEKYPSPKYPFYLLQHPFHTGFKGSRYFRWFAYKKVVRQLHQIIRQHEIDMVLGVFPDEFYTFTAMRAAKMNEIPFYSWFHNTYLDNRKGALWLLAHFIQPLIFKNSRKIFTMSDGMREFFIERYPKNSSKFHTLLHGFKTTNRHRNINSALNNPVRFLLSGNVNHSNRDSTVRLAKAILEHHPNNELHIYGKNTESDWISMGIGGNRVFLHGLVPLDDLIDRFPDYDIMLLPHGFEGNLSVAEYRTIFPTKTIPLLYSGRPILAHVPAETAIGQMLRRRNCAMLITDKSISKIKDAITDLISDERLRRELVSNAFEASKSYDVNNVAQDFITLLSKDAEDKYS